MEIEISQVPVDSFRLQNLTIKMRKNQEGMKTVCVIRKWKKDNCFCFPSPLLIILYFQRTTRVKREKKAREGGCVSFHFIHHVVLPCCRILSKDFAFSASRLLAPPDIFKKI